MKDNATTMKPQEAEKNEMMFDYESPRFNTAELCQIVLLVSVVFKAWWVLLLANVDIISINLTQWISLFSKIWVFYSLCYLIDVVFNVELKFEIQNAKNRSQKYKETWSLQEVIWNLSQEEPDNQLSPN